LRLRDKVAIVTGASRGLGRAISLALATEGATVVAAARSRPDETAKLVHDLGYKALPIVADVRDAFSVDNMITQTIQHFGRVDILVNNAGVFVPANVVDMSEDEWDLTIDVNMKGAFLCCRAAAKEMIKRKTGGRIVNISSNAGLIGYAGYAAYCASKWGLLGFTQSLAKELAPFQINVNAICPGDIETDMLMHEIRDVAKVRSVPEMQIRKEKMESIPLRRFAKPDEVARLVVFLCSDDAEYITGTHIKITGGK